MRNQTMNTGNHFSQASFPHSASFAWSCLTGSSREHLRPVTRTSAKAGNSRPQKTKGMFRDFFQRRDNMKKLGIRLEQDARRERDMLEPDFPLLAVAYSRFGYFRLANKNRKPRKN